MTNHSVTTNAVVSTPASVQRLHVAANDNSVGKNSVKQRIREYEVDLRYEHEDRLIEVMSVEQRVRYGNTGIVPSEYQALADEIEAEIAQELDLFREELRNAA